MTNTPASILIIEDEQSLCDVLSEFLSDKGYHVRTATNGMRGLELFRQSLPDLILCDLRMPGLSGLDVLKTVHREAPVTPFLIFSGTPALTQAVEAFRDGAWDYLTKPLDLAALVRAIERCLQRAVILRERQRNHAELEEQIRARTKDLEAQSTQLRQANEALSHEIAERRQAEEERSKLSDELRQAQKMEAIATLASGVAHDFNNLIMAMVGNLSMLELEALPQSARRYVTDGQRVCARAAALVRQLVTLSRQPDIKMQLLQLNTVVTEVRQVAEESFDPRIEVLTETSENLPTVLADHGQLLSALLNLCFNSRDAILNAIETTGPAPRKQRPRLTIRTREEVVTREQARDREVNPGWYAVLEVEDEGIGIDELVRPRIFEPFFTTKALDQGAGLGLSVVYGIVTHLGGFIEVKSVLGEGSTFSILLPVAQEAEKTLGACPTQVNQAPRGAETLLLVDDEQAIREVTQEYLERLGYTVLIAEDGEEGLRMIEELHDQVRLVVLDLSMPKLSGNQVLSRLRQKDTELPVIISSGSANARSQVHHKVHGFVLKPFRPADLAAEIRRVLNESAAALT